MSTHLDSVRPSGPSRRERRVERRRLQRVDVLVARLGELQAMDVLLEGATDVVTHGWIQRAWFVVRSEDGRATTVTAQGVRRASGLPTVGACLVGGIVDSGGGPDAATSQLVARTLDLTWHTLHEDSRQPVRWCPGPDTRMRHLQDLTRWNDAPSRTHGEVVGLLVAAQRTVEAQRDLCHDELAALGLPSTTCVPSPTARPASPTYSH